MRPTELREEQVQILREEKESLAGGREPVDNPSLQAITQAAKELVEQRERLLALNLERAT